MRTHIEQDASPGHMTTRRTGNDFCAPARHGSWRAVDRACASHAPGAGRAALARPVWERQPFRATTSRAVYSPVAPLTGSTVSVPRQVLPSRSWNDHDCDAGLAPALGAPETSELALQRACCSSARPKFLRSSPALCFDAPCTTMSQWLASPFELTTFQSVLAPDSFSTSMFGM